MKESNNTCSMENTSDIEELDNTIEEKTDNKLEEKNKTDYATTQSEIFGWSLWSWASNAYPTVVGVFLPSYITDILKDVADSNGFIYPFGKWFPIRYSSMFLMIII